MWLAEELYYRGINNYIQAYMGDTLVWEKLNNDYFYVKPLVGVTNISITLKGYYLDGFENPNRHNWRKRFITQEEAPYLEYSKDKKNWTVWQIEEHPDNANRQRFKPVQVRYGQTLYIRGINPDNSLSTIFEDENTIVVSQLYTDKDVEVGGDIFAVLNYQQSKFSSNRRIGDYGLTEFLSTLNLIYADKLYVDNLKEVGYCGLYMFQSVTYFYNGEDSKLKSTANIVIDEDTILNEYSLSHLLYGSIVCENYNVILNATTLAPYCYQSLFYANRLLTTTPELPATELVEGCYYEMFRGCYALEEIPDLPAKVIPSYAYYYMFGSTPLKKFTNNAEQIIGDYACAYMFSGCSGFTETPTFTNLQYVEGKYGFYSAFSRLPFSRIDLNEMFPSLTTEGVANSVSLFESILTSNPTIEEFVALNITKEPERIYSYTLQNCSNLKKITLYATELSNGSYYGMCYSAYNPSSLVEAPILRAKYVPSLAYTSMFYGCENLNKVISFAESWAGGSGNDRGAYNWLYDVAPEGTLYVPAGMIDKYPRGNNGNMHLPTGWNIQSIDTIADYLKFENFASVRYTTNGEISPNFEYSTDGVNFTKWEYQTLKASTIYLRGVNNQRISDMNNHLVIIDDDGSSSISGNIMSLVDGYGLTNEIPQEGMFEGLFLACDLGNITGLKLPATELKPYCYANMFDNTTLNYNSFELPATKLAEGCYKEMFANSDVRNAYTDYDYNDNPHIEGILTELPATELAPYCYAGMYKNCRRLQCTPNLPATKLAEGCYKEMFAYCDNQYFIEIDTLPATELAPYCYAGMYKNSSQTRTYAIITDIIPTYACANMYEGCKLDYVPSITANKIEEYGCVEMFVRTSNFTAAKIPDIIELAPYCYAGMYQQSSAIVIEASGKLDNLAPYCCEDMFAGSELTQISLPATKLEEGCYRDMFADCYNLNLIRCYAEELAEYSTMGWFKGVCSEGKFYTKNLSIWEGLDNNDGIPYCWSVEIID